MPSFVHLKLSDKLACQATVPSPQAVYGVLSEGDLANAGDVQAVDDQESVTFQFTQLDRTGTVRAIIAQLRAGRVITVVWGDGSFDEWRVGTVTQGRGRKRLVSVECVPLLLDLVERADSSTGKGWVSDVSGGERNFDYEITERTPSSILSTYVIPACPSYVTLGTVDPAYMIKALSWSRLTPGAVVLAVRDQLRSVDVTCEARLRRNGTTDYKLDLVTQIGASANTPVFHPNNALLALEKKADPTLQATRVLVKGATSPDGLPGKWGMARWRGGAPAGNVIALTDRNGGGSPIAFDGQFVGMWLLRVKTGRTFQITASSASAGSVTLTSVSTIAADEDFEFRLDEPLTNTRTTTTRYAVSAVPDGTHITMGVSVPITVDGQYTDWYAKVWSASTAGTVIATTRIAGSVAATDVIAVASSTGVTNAHFVEFIQLDGAGEIPSVVDHPVYSLPDPVGYGIKAMELSKPMLGVTQLVPNGWMRTWSNPANPPDGWTHTGNMTVSQNTSPAFSRYGGFSWKFENLTFLLDTNVFTSPPVCPAWDPGHTRLSCRGAIYFSTFVSDAFPRWVELSIYALTATGTLGTQLGAEKVMPSTSTDTVTIVDDGAWVEVKVLVALGPTTAPYGVVGVWRMFGGWTITGYIDLIEIYPCQDLPNDNFEFGDATALEQSGNNQLRAVASPPLYYTAEVRDLERAYPDEFPRLALTVGGNWRAADVEYGNDVTVRLLKRSRDFLNPSKTSLVLANRPTLASSIAVAQAAATDQKIADAATTGGSNGQAFANLTGATTLTQGADIITPMVGAPIITIPPPSFEQGMAVTFMPADPDTQATTGVTVGTPPSRRSPTAMTRGANNGGVRPPYYPVLSGEAGVVDTTYTWGDLKRFGARADLVKDDTAAFVAAFTAALAVPQISKVFVPSGDYLVTANLIFAVVSSAPRTIWIEFAPGAQLWPSAAVSVAMTLITDQNTDGTTNALKLTGLRLNGDATSGATGVLVGDNGGLVSGHIAMEDVKILRFTGASAKGLHVKDCVECDFTRVYAARNEVNLHVEGTANQGFPTTCHFDRCSFRDGPHRGVNLVMGHRCTWSRCVFESNAEEGFYCVPGATGDVDNCLITNSWLESNWTSASVPVRPTKYHLIADGTSGGLGLRLTDVNFEGVPRALYWKSVKDGVIDNPRVNNAANQITIDTGCVGTVRNWPTNHVDWPTVSTNASPTTFVAREVVEIVTVPSSTAGAGLLISTGVAPTSPADGVIWYDGVHFYGRVAGVTKQLDN